MKWNWKKILLGFWAAASILLFCFTFIVFHTEYYGFDTVSAARESFETIPEGFLMLLGFRGSPKIVTTLYWVLVVISIVYIIRKKKPK